MPDNTHYVHHYIAFDTKRMVHSEKVLDMCAVVSETHSFCYLFVLSFWEVDLWDCFIAFIYIIISTCQHPLEILSLWYNFPQQNDSFDRIFIVKWTKQIIIYPYSWEFKEGLVVAYNEIQIAKNAMFKKRFSYY